jgi:hypothetical protein
VAPRSARPRQPCGGCARVWGPDPSRADARVQVVHKRATREDRIESSFLRSWNSWSPPQRQLSGQGLTTARQGVVACDFPELSPRASTTAAAERCIVLRRLAHSPRRTVAYIPTLTLNDRPEGVAKTPVVVASMPKALRLPLPDPSLLCPPIPKCPSGCAAKPQGDRSGRARSAATRLSGPPGITGRVRRRRARLRRPSRPARQPISSR